MNTLKRKVIGKIPTGGGSVTVDDQLSDNSTNPVQNKVVKHALDQKVSKDGNKVLSDNNYSNEEKQEVAKVKDKQDKLVSGQTIKTLNGQSLLGKGNIQTEGGGGDSYTKEESDAKYQPKVAGKGLSTNDYTNQDKEKVAAALTEHQNISGKADKTALQAEITRATTAEENLRQLYNNLQQSQPIPVTQLPATGEAGKIYRLAGTTSYADYMYSENDLTTPIKMAEYNNAIDDEPIAGSDNLVKSGGVYDAIRCQDAIITEKTTEWKVLKSPLSGFIAIENHVAGTGNIQFATTTRDAVATEVRIRVNANKTAIVFLPQVYRYYATEIDGLVVHSVELSDMVHSLQIGDVKYCNNWTRGYVDTNLNFVATNDLFYIYTTISTIPGHYYLLPYSNNDGYTPLVSIDNGVIKGPLKRGSTGLISNTFTIVQAESYTTGITIHTGIENIGTELQIDEVARMPYLDLSTHKGDLLGSDNINQIKNILSLFDYQMTPINLNDIHGGYFDKDGHLEENNYGRWRYIVLDVDADAWYLINTAIFTAIRIFDKDDDGNMFINSSIPDGYYDIASNNKLSWVLVKPKYSKLGLSFVTPVELNNNDYSYPKYCKLERTANNGIMFLFLQLYEHLSEDIKKPIIVRKAGGADYTSLAEAILENVGKWGVTIHIDEGEYDIIQELVDYYGTEEFLPLTMRGRGIELYNDIILEGSPNALITANYQGSIDRMYYFFAPLNILPRANTGGATLRGINMRCTNVRYCVHDEKEPGTVGSYTNIYENCVMYLDNTANPKWHSAYCIGGGLGMSGNIMIRNCIFETKTSSTTWDNGGVSYHNNGAAGAKSIVSCTNNYMKGLATFKFTWYGESTEKTQIICSGNSLGRPVETAAETSDGTSPNNNIELYEWNNLIRE